MKLSGTTQYQVRINARRMMLEACNHELEGRVDPECRACDVNISCRLFLLDLKFWNDTVERERVAIGTASTPEGKLALARLVAFAYGHPDPIGLFIWKDEEGNWTTGKAKI